MNHDWDDGRLEHLEDDFALFDTCFMGLAFFLSFGF